LPASNEPAAPGPAENVFFDLDATSAIMPRGTNRNHLCGGL
jgi:hypothetical protein